MSDAYPPAKQRPALLAFATALTSRKSALRRDESGDWANLKAHAAANAFKPVKSASKPLGAIPTAEDAP